MMEFLTLSRSNCLSIFGSNSCDFGSFLSLAKPNIRARPISLLKVTWAESGFFRKYSFLEWGYLYIVLKHVGIGGFHISSGFLFAILYDHWFSLWWTKISRLCFNRILHSVLEFLVCLYSRSLYVLVAEADSFIGFIMVSPLFENEIVSTRRAYSWIVRCCFVLMGLKSATTLFTINYVCKLLAVWTRLDPWTFRENKEWILLICWPMIIIWSRPVLRGIFWYDSYSLSPIKSRYYVYCIWETWAKVIRNSVDYRISFWWQAISSSSVRI